MDRMTGSSINEADKHCRDIVIFIEEMGRQLPPPIDAKCSIYRVPKRLRNMIRKAYTPQVISIGPFHHRSPHLMSTEQYKLRALDSYRRRVNMTIEAIVNIAQNWENEARSCYAEPIKMKNDKFVTMLLLDGCFIVEFLKLDYDKYFKIQNGLDTSFYEAMSSDIYLDITMLENQIPFFVLRGLFDLIPTDELENMSLIKLTDLFFGTRSMKNYELPPNVSPQNVKHLVDLLSLYFSPLRDTKQHEKNNRTHDGSFLSSPSITELYEAGVTMKRGKVDNCLMDINFKNGVLEIPPLDIDDHFETIVRNLMAFEHYPTANQHRFTIQYDLRLLVKAGIIINNIGGSDKEVSRLFNDICKYITISSDSYYLNDTIKLLRDHCKKWWPRSKATLRRDYFNSPWAFISVIAAAFIIILTLLQTIFTAISTFD